MRAFNSSIVIDPETAARVSEDFWRKWQETVSDATETWFEATKARAPANMLSVQLEFGVRNVQRWCGWAPVVPVAETEAAPASEAVPEFEAVLEGELTPEPDPAPETEEAPEAEAVSEAATEAFAESLAEPENLEPAAAGDEPAEDPEDENADAGAEEAAGPADGADDLTRIRGIGPAIERKLHDQGITTFRQIAGMSEADIEKLDDVLDFRGRIDRDEWVKQASQLVQRSH